MTHPLSLPAMEALIEEYGMIPPGGTVLCAVSGGADSVCLLHALAALRSRIPFTLRAAHYNHRLRGAESDRDEAFVRAFVSRLGGEGLPPVEVTVGSGDVAGEARRRGRGIEETARAMRDASSQEGGLAGLGAGMALGNTMVQGMEAATSPAGASKNKADQLRELKELLDEGILTQEEFDAEKKAILGKRS